VVPDLLGYTRDDDMLVITADHGNDPTTPSTDHSREHAPLILTWPRGRSGVDLGVRESFADLGATLADVFHAARPRNGASFIGAIR
jgi:phosphopentomutase